MGLPKEKCSEVKALELKRELQRILDAEIKAMPSDMTYLEKLRKKARSSRLVKKFRSRTK
jgi:hypothetical protein